MNSKKKIETNAKIVEWSDGTWHLAIGDELIDITPSEVNNTRIGVVNKEKDVVVIGKNVDKKMILKASEFEKSERKGYIHSPKQVSAEKSSLSKTKLAHSFYDKNEYIKDDFGGKFGKAKNDKEKKTDVIIQTIRNSNLDSSRTKKKRNRSDLNNE